MIVLPSKGVWQNDHRLALAWRLLPARPHIQKHDLDLLHMVI